MAGELIRQPFAAGGDVGILPQTDPSGFVNWTQGYTPFYEINLGSGNPQAKAVERTMQNALFNIVTGNIQEWQQLGFSVWHPDMPSGYQRNAIVMRSNGTSYFPYRSLVDANIDDPLTAPTKWEYQPLATEIRAVVPMKAGGANGSAGEVITAAIDFNTLATGSWEIRDDAIAAGSANSPAVSGSTAYAGFIETKSWENGASNYKAQRYLDRKGNAFFRGYDGTTWSSWIGATPTSEYSLDTSTTANLVTATFPLQSSIIPDCTMFWVKVKGTNNGSVTFSPNPAVFPAKVVAGLTTNAALQGGELNAAGRALFIYRADQNNFSLAFCEGGRTPVQTGNQSFHAVNLSQMNAAIASAVSGGTSLQLNYYMGQF